MWRINSMKTVILKGKSLGDGTVKFEWPEGGKQEGVQYIIEYKYKGIIVSHTYHEFWECPSPREENESFRLTFLNFGDGKDE